LPMRMRIEDKADHRNFFMKALNGKNSVTDPQVRAKFFKSEPKEPQATER